MATPPPTTVAAAAPAFAAVLPATPAPIRFKVQGFFICHIIVIQGIIRSEM